MQKVLFIDRDGTLIEEPPNQQVDALAKIRFVAHVIPSLLSLIQAGYRLVMVSNQDGLGTSSFPSEAFAQCQEMVLAVLESQGIVFSDIFICPHFSKDNCNCRKPKTGLLENFLQQQEIDYANSWVIGDRDSDAQLAANLQVGFLPITSQHGWQQISQRLANPPRCATVQRQTKETAIAVTVNLDNKNPSTLNTPLPFFNHLLEQIAHHGLLSLTIEATGDIEVDDHHLIEDTALTLGEALKKALGDKQGIARYGFTLPMDEALAQVALDLSGRPHCSFNAPFTREMVGGMATEMIAHFFKSFSYALGASIHVSVRGENHHHMIEACFKALGKTLAQAFARQGFTLPSTKGVL